MPEKKDPRKKEKKPSEEKLSDKKTTEKEIEKTNKSIESNEEALEKISIAKERSLQAFQEQQQKLNSMEGEITGQTEEEKMGLEREQDIRENQRDNRGKKARYEGYMLDKKLSQFEEQNISDDDKTFDKQFDKLLKLEMVKTVRQQPQQPIQNNSNNALTSAVISSMLNQNNNLTNRYMDGIENRKDSNLKEELAKTLSIAKDLGYSKSNDIPDSWQSVLGIGLNKLSEIGGDLLKQKQQQKQNPSQQIIKNEKGEIIEVIENPKPAPIQNSENSIAESQEGQEPVSIAPQQIEPSDQQLLNNPRLANDSRPSFVSEYDEEAGGIISQSLNINKFSRWQTDTPQTKQTA